MREITLRFLAEPGEVNFGGKVHGGTVMRWIDQAGYSCAVGWSRSYCVTVYVGGIRFLKPIQIGELVEVEAKVIYTGTTSMHIAVDLWARALSEPTRHRTTHCIIVFVAVNQSGKPQTVPAWEPVDPSDLKLRDYARRLMQLRQGIEQEMEAFLHQPEPT
jgi:acyl-CoA hydrolase